MRRRRGRAGALRGTPSLEPPPGARPTRDATPPRRRRPPLHLSFLSRDVSPLPGTGIYLSPARAKVLVLALSAVAASFALPALAQPPRIQRAELRLAVDRTAYDARRHRAPGRRRRRRVRLARAGAPTDLRLSDPHGSESRGSGRLAGSGDHLPEPGPLPLRLRRGAARRLRGPGARSSSRSRCRPTPRPGRSRCRATLRYQACDDKQCLPPVEREAELALTVGAGGVAANAELFAPEAGPAPAATETATDTAPPAARGLLGFLLLGARRRADPERHAVRAADPLAQGLRPGESGRPGPARRGHGRPRHRGRHPALVLGARRRRDRRQVGRRGGRLGDPVPAPRLRRLPRRGRAAVLRSTSGACSRSRCRRASRALPLAPVAPSGRESPATSSPASSPP